MSLLEWWYYSYVYFPRLGILWVPCKTSYQFQSLSQHNTAVFLVTESPVCCSGHVQEEKEKEGIELSLL
jgi:hypothetical protein